LLLRSICLSPTSSVWGLDPSPSDFSAMYSRQRMVLMGYVTDWWPHWSS